ncbi:hypothetical protein EJ06DRAFT_53399 [Trichodelitschia bisporula]|uniref:Uncharacterized protein n=1 Tax=Trichodelitschia bisporula TaxID=703511 RepID=A0A6G1HUQ8_9PEZI|nr:hypothetical protein EJ06DRAFT_53399 [Trichodelitschia bisporula]
MISPTCGFCLTFDCVPTYIPTLFPNPPAPFPSPHHGLTHAMPSPESGPLHLPNEASPQQTPGPKTQGRRHQFSMHAEPRFWAHLDTVDQERETGVLGLQPRWGKWAGLEVRCRQRLVCASADLRCPQRRRSGPSPVRGACLLGASGWSGWRRWTGDGPSVIITRGNATCLGIAPAMGA